MPVVIPLSIVLSATPEQLGGDLPIIGWDNRIGAGGVSADHEAPGYPASNLANPSTAARWQSDSTDEQYVTFALTGLDPIDYVGIARHNLGSGGVNVSVEISDGDGGWAEVFAPVVLAGDAPALLRFEAQFTTQVRLRLQGAGAPPRMAVVYVGALLVLPRGVQPGIVPLPFAAQDEIVTGKAESGDFLGRIVTSQALATSVSVQWISDAWFRANMARFVPVARTRPFFFAWRPLTHPADVGYAWMQNDLRPEAHETGEGEMLHLSLQLGAIAL